MEASMLRLEGMLETRVQQSCRRIFLEMAKQIQILHKGARLRFVQIDNGADLTVAGKIRKWAEGTNPDFPDVLLLASTPCGQFNKVEFVEFKRIGSPSQVQIRDGQLQCQKDLQAMGWPAEIINNPIYFEQIICARFWEFFNKNIWKK